MRCNDGSNSVIADDENADDDSYKAGNDMVMTSNDGMMKEMTMIMMTAIKAMSVNDCDND